MGLNATFAAIMSELSAIKAGMLPRTELSAEVEGLKTSLAAITADRDNLKAEAEKVSAEFRKVCEEKAAISTERDTAMADLVAAIVERDEAKASAAKEIDRVCQYEASLGKPPVPSASNPAPLFGIARTAATQKINKQ